MRWKCKILPVPTNIYQVYAIFPVRLYDTKEWAWLEWVWEEIHHRDNDSDYVYHYSTKPG